MKSVYYLLVLVTLCHGVPLNTKVAQLSAPSTVRVALLDPLAIEVSWNKIDSGDKLDPVLGYKVKVWEVKNIEAAKYTEIDGIATLVMEDEPIDQISGPHEIVTTAEKTTASYHNIKLGGTYEVRVQAFTKKIDGPLSDPVRVQLEKH